MLETRESALLIDHLVRRLLTAGRVTSPPVEPFTLVETLASDGGVVLATHSLDPEKLRALARFARLQDRPNPRQNLEVCRLLFHYLLRTGCRDHTELESWSLLATRSLLMPEEWFRERAEEFSWDLLALQEAFSTAGPEQVALRILDFKEGVMTLFDSGAVRRRVGSPGLVVEAEMSALEAALVRHVLRTEEYYQQAAEYREQKLVMRGWPILERGRVYCVLLTLGESDWPDRARKRAP